ncbi:MAG: KpsF/GutQ family sugar-phosphate isomerase [Bacteroidetes bacterium]|nr:KpsF/GutQ family sugar-phosphate isomerase [Bacteroidota bacterium]MBS1973224.1 KpsF/GutQ family sugar-phosphate isomerase [Bacteroidota bacterium]
MTNQSITETALRTIRLEAGSIIGLEQYINDDFVKAVNTIAACKGRIVVSGIGKSGIIAQKIVATLNSTGTPAVFMHAADAIHGDLGMIQPDDIVILISKSGVSPEIKVLLPFIKNFNNTLVAIVGSMGSLLAQQADIVLNTAVTQEACPNNLAPTSSTTAQLVMGDALAVALMELRGFNSNDFAKFHPGGTLGKRLYLRVQDFYLHNEKPKVEEGATLKRVIMEMTSKRLGATAVVDKQNNLLGIITDGDLRRMLEKNIASEKTTAKDIMTKTPVTVDLEALAVEALDILRSHDITQLIVTDKSQYLGFIHLHDLIREGII